MIELCVIELCGGTVRSRPEVVRAGPSRAGTPRHRLDATDPVWLDILTSR